MTETMMKKWKIGKRVFRYRGSGAGGLLRFTFRVWVREGHVEFDITTRKRQFISSRDPRGRDGRAEA